MKKRTLWEASWRTPGGRRGTTCRLAGPDQCEISYWQQGGITSARYERAPAERVSVGRALKRGHALRKRGRARSGFQFRFCGSR